MNESREKIYNQSTEINSVEKEKEPFPENVVVLATHGSYYVPFREIPKEDVSKFPEEDIRIKEDENGEEKYFLNIRQKLSPEMGTGISKGEPPRDKRHLLRLLKNFSDSLTRKMLQGIPDDQKVTAWFSRAIGDPARDENADDLFREYDFMKNEELKNPVWKEKLTKEEKEWLLENFHKKYHEKVEETIKRTEEKIKEKGGRVIVFDIHDTGELMMNVNETKDYKREGGFPDINLGDMDGRACDPQITSDFAKILKKYWKENFGNEPDLKINTPYKGKGYVTTHYGAEYNDNLIDDQKFQRNVIQIELGRYLYMDEKTQKPNRDKIKQVREILQKAMAELGRKYETV